MIEGWIDERGVPVIELPFAGRTWLATIDTGFNGHLELPEILREAVAARFVSQTPTLLAGGHVITENQYVVRFPFDGELLRVRAAFAPGNGILLGTQLLKPYRLTVDFPDGKVWLERD